MRNRVRNLILLSCSFNPDLIWILRKYVLTFHELLIQYWPRFDHFELSGGAPCRSMSYFHFDYAELLGCPSCHLTIYSLNVHLVSTILNCQLVRTAISCANDSILTSLRRLRWCWTFKTCPLFQHQFLAQALPTFYFQFVCNTISWGFFQ